MEDRHDIVFNIVEGKDKSITTLFKIGDSGEYRPLAMCDEMSFVSDVEHSDCIGVKVGDLSFSLEVSEHSCDILRMLFGCSDEFSAQSEAFNRLLNTHDEYVGWVKRFCSLARKGKRRKTTYKTIRRDCAKRNRHK